MARYLRHTREHVLEAIPGSRGITVEIARRLDVSRQTVLDYCKRWPTVQEAFNEEVETVGDRVETNILKVLYDDSLPAADRQFDASKWYARMKLKNRGYVERTEQTGKDGADQILKVIVQYADRNLDASASPSGPAPDDRDGEEI